LDPPGSSRTGRGGAPLDELPVSASAALTAAQLRRKMKALALDALSPALEQASRLSPQATLAGTNGSQALAVSGKARRRMRLANEAGHPDLLKE
jgi:hypothetical protein